ncbi:hypothetical protein CPB83DRAFT_887970 [Crepidotus variabilis]|uniref:Uncharacterized protein n=1 Tax=Crepidotus variabilis TaxID=179855 RepID=A0A9P6EU36_9AGAR|nr:hypothetical protein CPB83DRAFT_887970 [Crepidotus variabilis]
MPQVRRPISRAAANAILESYQSEIDMESPPLPVRTSRGRLIVPPRRADEEIPLAGTVLTSTTADVGSPHSTSSTQLDLDDASVHQESDEEDGASSGTASNNTETIPFDPDAAFSMDSPSDSDRDELNFEARENSSIRDLNGGFPNEFILSLGAENDGLDADENPAHSVDIQLLFPDDPAAENVAILRRLLGLSEIPEDVMHSSRPTSRHQSPVTRDEMILTARMTPQPPAEELAELVPHTTFPTSSNQLAASEHHEDSTAPSGASSNQLIPALPSAASVEQTGVAVSAANTPQGYLQSRFGELRHRSDGFKAISSFKLAVKRFVSADAVLTVRQQLDLASTVGSRVRVNDAHSGHCDLLIYYEDVTTFLGESPSPCRQAQGHINMVEKLWELVRMDPDKLTTREATEVLPLLVALVGNGTDLQKLSSGQEVKSKLSVIRFKSAAEIIRMRGAGELDDATTRVLKSKYSPLFVERMQRVYDRLVGEEL